MMLPSLWLPCHANSLPPPCAHGLIPYSQHDEHLPDDPPVPRNVNKRWSCSGQGLSRQQVDQAARSRGHSAYPPAGKQPLYPQGGKQLKAASSKRPRSNSSNHSSNASLHRDRPGQQSDQLVNDDDDAMEEDDERSEAAGVRAGRARAYMP